MMEENTFEKWNEAIKNMDMEKRPPMWDKAIKYLVGEGAMEPTLYNTLTQGFIQEIMLELECEDDIHDLFQSFSKWLISPWGESKFYVFRFQKGNELWLAFLMATQYAMEWREDHWAEIGTPIQGA